MTTLGIARKTLLSAALLAATTAAQAVSYNIFNDQGGWLSSVQAMGPTTFGTGTFASNTGAAGSVVLNGLPGVSFTQVGSGSASYDGGLLNNLGSGGYLEWLFTTPQNGWGGTFAMATQNGLSFKVLDLPEGQENLGWIDAGADVGAGQTLAGFYGFSSTERFGGVRVFPLSSASSYKMTDVSIARADPISVPEPGSLALLALAGGALAFTRRRRQA